MTFIYALCDPDGSARYIGKANDPKQRLRQHVNQARSSQAKFHRLVWLRKLLREGFRPGLLIIEECPEEAWQDRERFWITEYRRRGADLVNTSDGGVGSPGRVVTAEFRKLISDLHKGKPKSRLHRERIRQANLGYKHTPEALVKIRQANRRRIGG